MVAGEGGGGGESIRYIHHSSLVLVHLIYFHFAARGEGGTQLWEGVTLQLGEREELNSEKVSLCS